MDKGYDLWDEGMGLEVSRGRRIGTESLSTGFVCVRGRFGFDSAVWVSVYCAFPMVQRASSARETWI